MKTVQDLRLAFGNRCLDEAVCQISRLQDLSLKRTQGEKRSNSEKSSSFSKVWCQGMESCSNVKVIPGKRSNILVFACKVSASFVHWIRSAEAKTEKSLIFSILLLDPVKC